MSDSDRLLTGRDPLEAGIEALREQVPTRPEWRARLLAEIAALPAPARAERAARLPDVRRRALMLSPSLALAAAMGFMMLGAGTVYLLLRERATPSASFSATADATTLPGTGVSDTAMGAPLVTVRFMLVAPEARRVALVGDFNQWNAGATPMRKARDGQRWIIEVGLRPGRHAYAFVVDDDVVADPAAPSAVGEDFGVRSSVVLVSESGR